MLYEGVMNGLFEGSINTAIFLEKSHRFDEDPVFGALLKRVWKGELTEEDIQMLNTRVVGQNGVTLPAVTTDDDACYACPINKQRNATSGGIFQKHLLSSGEFPPIDSEELPPSHTVIIEADIHSCTTANKKEKTRVSREMRDRIINTCGDAHVRSGQSKKIDPCLRIYKGAHAMCIDNSKLKENKLGNGTLCRVKGMKLKPGAPPLHWKNWDGVKVFCTSARYVEWVEFDRFPVSEEIKLLKSEIDVLEKALNKSNECVEDAKKLEKLQTDLRTKEKAQCFKLSPTKFTAVVQVTLDDSVSERRELKGVGITQVPINMNDATTGHKLQGMSKDKLIIVDWTFVTNWIYVVLSRVRTLNGLFLLKPLPPNCLDKFQVPRELQAFERRMKSLERAVLELRERRMAALELVEHEGDTDAS
ncbi:hypothetical protein ACHAXR_004496 [Thalassiosira sp. AJA248-18]